MALVNNSQAKTFLRTFVSLCEKFYGKKCQVLNVHSLIHLADDVVNMQCTLSEIAAFPFESELHRIHSMLRTGYRPLAQVCRRLHELHFAHATEVHLSLKLEILKKLNSDKLGITTVKKIRYNGSILKSTNPNNTVLLANGTVLEIDKMYV